MQTTQLVCQKPCNEELSVSVQPCYLSERSPRADGRSVDSVGGKEPFSQGSVCQCSRLSGALARAGREGLHAKMLSVLCLQVVLLGIDILSALVSRLQDRFKAQIGTGKGSVCESGGCRHRSGGIHFGCCTQSLLFPLESTRGSLLKGGRPCPSIGRRESRGAVPL